MRLQQGDLKEAIQDFKVYFASEKDEQGLMQQAEEAFNAFSHLQNNNNCDMENLNIVLRSCPRFLEMLQRRAECLLKNDNIPEAINDYARYLRLQPNNQLHLKLATLYITLGELDNSLGSVKECLRSDPDHKDCKKQFKTIKKLQKDFAALQESISKRKWTEATRMLFDEGLVQQVEAYNANNLNKIVYLAACQAYARMRQHDNCIKYCSKVLEIDSENLEARINRAQSHLTNQNFDQAKSDFAKAHELDRSNQKVILLLT